MANALNTDRVTKLIVLLSSDKDGEVMAAVRALDRTLKDANLTWHDLAARIQGNVSEEKKKRQTPRAREPKPQAKRYTTSEERFIDLLNSKLTAWERDFVNSVHIQWKRKGSFSQKQSDILSDISERVRRR